MGDDSGCVFGMVGNSFAVVAPDTPIVALDAHRILAISGDDENRARLADAMRKWKELSGVQYPGTASAAKFAQELISRHGYSIQALAVGYDTPTDTAVMHRVYSAAPYLQPEADYGALGPGTLACKEVIDAGYRHGMSVGDAIELADRCVAEIRRLGLSRATNEFTVLYIDRDGVVPVKREIMEAMARGRKMATDFLNSSGLVSYQLFVTIEGV